VTAWSEALAQVERCGCGVLVLKGWPKPHTCTAKPDAVLDSDPGDEQQELRRDAEADDLGPEDLSEPWERMAW